VLDAERQLHALRPRVVLTHLFVSCFFKSRDFTALNDVYTAPTPETRTARHVQSGTSPAPDLYDDAAITPLHTSQFAFVLCRLHLVLSMDERQPTALDSII